MRTTWWILWAAACVSDELPPDATMGDGGAWAQAGAESGRRATTICPSGATLPGIDVSYWQSTIDWDRASGEVDFAFIRVSDGLNTFDTQFDRNWGEAKRTGVARGAYQFFRPSQDAEAQADLLLDTMGPLEDGDLPPVIDVEVSDGQSVSTVVSGVREWIDRVEGELGVAPMIYTSWGLWSSLTGDTGEFADYPLWIANWGVSCPSVPNAWGGWEVWQTSATGSVSGISGDVDENLFDGDLGALVGFGFDGTTTPPEPCATVPAQGRTLEETDPCFFAGGPAAYWHEVAAGSGGSLLYTHATDFSQVENYGIWSIEVDVSGEYRVEAYTAAPHAESELAAYEVTHADGVDVFVVDQTAVNGWSEVGLFWFDAGEGYAVRLDDNTGEPWNGGEIQLVYDGLRLTPTAVTEPTTEPTESTEPTEPTEATDTAGTFDPPDRSASGGASSFAPAEPQGCGCAATPSSLGLAPWLALALAWRRRSRGA